MKQVDLHMHSQSSDGMWTADQILQEIINKGIRIFSITDHDTLENSRYISTRIPDQIEFHIGVEITASLDSQEIHILAYDIDTENVNLNELIGSNSQIRKSYYKNLVRFAFSEGLFDSIDDYPNFKHNRALGVLKDFHYLKGKGVINNLSDLAEIAEAYGQTPIYQSVKDVVHCIHQAGGAAILAHPSAYNGRQKLDTGKLNQFKSCGIDGIEVYSPYLNEISDVEYYKSYCKSNGLGATAGSDFHGGFLKRCIGQPTAFEKDIDLSFMSYTNRK